MNAGNPYGMGRLAVDKPAERGCCVRQWTHNKSDPARCVNTMCAGPRRTGLEFD